MKLFKIVESLNPSNPKGVSFSASLVCVFMYVSIFYIFDISPSTLLNNTRFWFIITNTLILIIAADYGSFSSSKALTIQDVHHHHHHQETTMSMSMSPQSQEPARNKTINNNNTSRHPSLLVSQQSPEMIDKRIVIYKPALEEELEGLDDEYGIERRRSMFGRSKSETAIKVVHPDDDHNKSSTTLHRCESERHHHRMIADDDDDEENELSNLSDEELNKRVEEFIQKFNAHLRLQAEATKSGHYT